MTQDPDSTLASAANRWRQRCLLADGSVFTNESLWTLDNVHQLVRYFVENLDEGEGNFQSKLRAQLAPAAPGAKKLAAEMLWVMYLIVHESFMRPETKRLQVETVWGWSGEPGPDDSDMLDETMSAGVANPGKAYNTHRWRELVFFIRLMEQWKKLPEERKRDLLDDGFAFAEWMDGQAEASGRQLRHALLFLLFPDHFDPIVSDQHKRAIVKRWYVEAGGAIDDLDLTNRVAVDRALDQVRRHLEPEDPAFDFYRDPWQTAWRGATAESGVGAPEVIEEPSADAWAREQEESSVGLGYSLERAMEDLFISPDRFGQIVDLLGRKMNLILQGPPGTGKSFVARRIAYRLMDEADTERVRMVQFHQAYAYEDFVQGYRPTDDGGFHVKDGLFYEFCRRAAADRERKYVFIIDEINRGNLPRIMGELMLLIEADKRTETYAMPLTYSANDDEPFHVPDNLYLLGMMNTADRSLAMVDYALRRRFAFVTLAPEFQSDAFADHLVRAGVPGDLVGKIQERMTRLNEVIADDRRNLGRGFEIGHSYFVPTERDASLDEEWYRRVIRSEIEPLLREYWFDQPERVDEQVRQLLS